MKGNQPQQGQISYMAPHLSNICDPKHPLRILAEKIPWDYFERELASLYSHTGKPAMPIRLMTGLLILKQMNGLGDETVVEKWVENPYFQYFTGEAEFQWRLPFDPSDFVHFRKRIGVEGVEKILQVSIALHGKKAMEKEIVIDTTVQEANITFPTDSKLHSKIIDQCVKIAKVEGVALRRSYKRTVKKHIMAQRFRRHPKNRKRALSSARQLKTIAGRLLRELERKLSVEQKNRIKEKLALFQRVLQQRQNDKKKIYSLHEPGTCCIGKGKEHKKYEFGLKASIALTRNSGIAVGALCFSNNPYDGHTLPEVIKQVGALRGSSPTGAICDRGYRGKSKIDETRVFTPKSPRKNATAYEKRKARMRFRRRAGIEPIIGHLKKQFGLGRNFLKGNDGSMMNVMLAAAAFNFKKLMRAWALLCVWILRWILPEKINQSYQGSLSEASS